MIFLRLNDYLLSVLYENSDIIAVDKPYGISTHTNDAKAGNEDLIEDGLIEIYEKQLKHKLYIVHRLDKTTSGVIIFAKSEEARKKYADFFFNREVKKTYWFITDTVSHQESFSINSDIIHKGKNLAADTDFAILKKTSDYSLWKASPHTGRNHQIRIHAQAAGLSLLGDSLYGGSAYPFLCLHNQRMEFPNGVSIESQPPHHFTDLSWLKNKLLAQVELEIDRRLRLFKNAAPEQCFRLAYLKSELSLDKFGSALLLTWYKDSWSESDQKTFEALSVFCKHPILVRLVQKQLKSEFIIGAEQLEKSWIALEHKTKYEIKTDSGQSLGLFSDQRLQREWVQNNSKDKTVLNLFSYTCGFSLAAALGECAQVTSVDSNKNALNWGRRNFEINALSTEAHKFLCRDAKTFLDQCLSKNVKYDLIICDPPSFSRGENGIFKIEKDIESLLQKCINSLTSKGQLLFSTNYENFYIDDLRKLIIKINPSAQISNIVASLDFELPDQKPGLISFLISLQ